MSSQPFLVLHLTRLTNTKSSDDTRSWEYLSTSSVQFSDCGSFCFLAVPNWNTLILKSKLLEENAAKMQSPAVWGDNTSYNQLFFKVGWHEESTMVKLYQAHDQVESIGFRDFFGRYYATEVMVEVAITAIPAHLASGQVYLLVGKGGDDLTRMLFLPQKGPPEIKYLRVTLNQILAELATRSEESDDTMTAYDDTIGVSDSEESSDTRSQEAAISADGDRPGVSDTD